MIVHGYYANTDTYGQLCDVESAFFIPKYFEGVTKGTTTISQIKESLKRFPRKYFPDDCILHITSDVLPEYEEDFNSEGQLWEYLITVEKYTRLFKTGAAVYVLITCPDKNWSVHYTIIFPSVKAERTARTQRRVEMER